MRDGSSEGWLIFLKIQTQSLEADLCKIPKFGDGLSCRVAGQNFTDSKNICYKCSVGDLKLNSKCCNSSNAFPGKCFVHYLTIIPRARVGYEMIDSQRGA